MRGGAAWAVREMVVESTYVWVNEARLGLKLSKMMLIIWNRKLKRM